MGGGRGERKNPPRGGVLGPGGVSGENPAPGKGGRGGNPLYPPRGGGRPRGGGFSTPQQGEGKKKGPKPPGGFGGKPLFLGGLKNPGPFRVPLKFP